MVLGAGEHEEGLGLETERRSVEALAERAAAPEALSVEAEAGSAALGHCS